MMTFYYIIIIIIMFVVQGFVLELVEFNRLAGSRIFMSFFGGRIDVVSGHIAG